MTRSTSPPFPLPYPSLPPPPPRLSPYLLPLLVSSPLHTPTHSYHIPTADDIEVMQATVRTALQSCCLQLKGKLVRQAAAREQAQRKRALTKYIPNVAAAVYAVLANIAAKPPGAAVGVGLAPGACAAAWLGRGSIGDGRRSGVALRGRGQIPARRCLLGCHSHTLCGT